MTRRLLGGAFLASLAAPLCAQDATPVIVVTAPGGGIDADEAQTVDGDAIARGPRADLAGALAQEIPGVSIAEATGNPWQAAITWRGYGVSALQGTEQGMAVYLDGVRFNQPFGDTVTLDLLPENALIAAQVNAASPIYGRNALGGAILLQTATGGDLPGVRGTVSADSFGSYGAAASVGTDAIFLAVDAQHDDGWRDASPSRLLRGLAGFSAGGSNWKIDAKLIAADTRLVGNGVAPVELLDADYRAVFTRPDISDSRFARATVMPTVDIGAPTRIEATIHYQALRRDTANGDAAEFGPCDDDGSLLCVGEDDEGFEEGLIDAGTLLPFAIDPDVDDYAVFNRGRERTRGGGAGVQLIDRRTTAVGDRVLALGVVYDEYRTKFDAGSELGTLEYDRSVDPLGVTLVSDGGGITQVSLISRLRDIAAFANAEIPLVPHLSAEIGARWSYNRVQLIDRIGTALNGIHAFRRLSPSAELDFEPTDELSISAGYAQTSRNPTPAELSCADPDAPCALANFFVADPPLDPVVADNFHIDAKYEPLPGLTLQTALWRSDSRDDIRHIPSDIRGRAYFANLGRSRRQGFDLSARWQRGNWRLGADYTLSDARFRSDFAISSPANPAADEDGGDVAVTRGDRLPNAPRHSVNLRAQYDTPRWGIGGYARIRSSQFLVGDEGNDNPPIAGYAVFDAVGRVAIADGVEVVAELRNIFNKRYASFGTFSEVEEVFLAEAPGASDPRAYAPGMPRRFSASIRFQF